MAIKIYCVTKERLTRLNHSGYFIFIDSFSTEQEDCDLHLFLFAHPGQLPDRFLFFLLWKQNDKPKQALRSSQTFSPWQPPSRWTQDWTEDWKRNLLARLFPCLLWPYGGRWIVIIIAGHLGTGLWKNSSLECGHRSLSSGIRYGHASFQAKTIAASSPLLPLRSLREVKLMDTTTAVDETSVMVI